MMTKFFAALLAQQRSREVFISAEVGDNISINRSVEILFDIATCRTRCRHGDHIIERLAGRIVNQIISAIILDSCGFHDEALSLLRNSGEIVNLLALFALDPQKYKDWVLASPKTRRRKFSPSAVRKAIRSLEVIAVPMNDFTYSEISHEFVHANPDVAPNFDDESRRMNVGGNAQEKRSKKFSEDLEHISWQGAATAAGITGRQELVKELLELNERYL